MLNTSASSSSLSLDSGANPAKYAKTDTATKSNKICNLNFNLIHLVTDFLNLSDFIGFYEVKAFHDIRFMANVIGFRSPGSQIEAKKYVEAFFSKVKQLANFQSLGYSQIAAQIPNLLAPNSFPFRTMKRIIVVAESQNAACVVALSNYCLSNLVETLNYLPRFMLRVCPHISQVSNLNDEQEKIRDRILQNSITTIPSTQIDYSYVRKLMLRCRPSVDATIFYKDRNLTPLTVAVKVGYLSVVTDLYNQGASVNGEGNHNGLTPLHEAARTGNVEVCKFLLDKRALIKKDRSNETPIDLAKQNPKKEVLNLLVNAQLAERPPNVNGLVMNLTYLRHSINTKDLSCIKNLLHWGADPDLGDDFNTPLIDAVLYFPQALEVLLGYKAAIDKQPKATGMTALMHCADKGLPNEVLDLLLKSNASMTIKDNKGNTVAHYAAKTAFMNALLLAFKLYNENKKLTIIDLLQHNSQPFKQLLNLAARNCDFNVQNSQGKTPRAFACQNVVDVWGNNGYNSKWQPYMILVNQAIQEALKNYTGSDSSSSSQDSKDSKDSKSEKQ